MQEFIMPLFGGLLIGLSASLLLLLIGKVAGISGILWGAVSAFGRISQQSNQRVEKTSGASNAWRWLFLLGMMVGTWLFHFISKNPYPMPEFSNSSVMTAVIAGLFVGVGVKVGSGCTSGHGVCGIGRLSLRSLTATIVFMVVAVFTVLLMRLGGLS